MRRAVFVLALLTVTSMPARAQWSTAPGVDNLACNAIRAQSSPIAVSDGAGGVVTVWEDLRTGSRHDLYAQHTDANGVNLWGPAGTAVDTSLGTILDFGACTDDSGGIVVVWHRGTTLPDRIVAQRIDTNGNLRWGPLYRVSLAEKTQSLPRVVPDGQGGVLVFYAHWRGAATANVFGQRLDRNGVRLWGADGDSVIERGEIRSIAAIRRAAGGAFLGFWRSNGLIRAWAVDNDNHGLWTQVDTLTLAPMATAPPAINGIATTDGALFTVDDGTKLLARKFVDAGAAWPSSRWVATHGGTKSAPQFASDVAGGAFVAWRDGRVGRLATYYIQHMSASGDALWGVDGQAILTSTNNAQAVALGADGAGGVWAASNDSPGLWAQHYGFGGEAWLPAAGVNLSSTNRGFQSQSGTILPGSNGSYVFVGRGRALPVTAEDVYMRHFYGNGSLSTVGVDDAPRTGALALAAGPNPARDAATLRFALPRAGHARLEVFGLRGERVATLADGALPAGAHARSLDLRALPPGVYHARLVTDDGAAVARLVRVK